MSLRDTNGIDQQIVHIYTVPWRNTFSCWHIIRGPNHYAGQAGRGTKPFLEILFPIRSGLPFSLPPPPPHPPLSFSPPPPIPIPHYLSLRPSTKHCLPSLKNVDCYKKCSATKKSLLQNVACYRTSSVTKYRLLENIVCYSTVQNIVCTITLFASTYRLLENIVCYTVQYKILSAIQYKTLTAHKTLPCTVVNIFGTKYRLLYPCYRLG